VLQEFTTGYFMQLDVHLRIFNVRALILDNSLPSPQGLYSLKADLACFAHFDAFIKVEFALLGTTNYKVFHFFKLK
jgi:hypothetical protein